MTFKTGQRVRHKGDGDTGTFIQYRHVPAGTYFPNNAHGAGMAKHDLDCEVHFDSTNSVYCERSENLELIADIS